MRPKKRMAASLKSRLLRSSEAVRPVQELLFPLASVRGFLESHPVLNGLELTVAEVHTAILEVHKRCQGTSDEGASSQTTIVSCFECGSRQIVVDVREGNHVCDHCGLVQHRGSINVTMEYTLPADVSKGSRRKQTILRNVPSWRIHKSLTNDRRERRSKSWNELEHYNAHVHLPEDDLVRMDRLLCGWIGGGHSSNARIAAVLLYLPLLASLPSEETVRSQVRTGSALPMVETVEPTAQYECATCGKACHTKKDARFCCRFSSWGQKKRPRSTY